MRLLPLLLLLLLSGCSAGGHGGWTADRALAGTSGATATVDAFLESARRADLGGMAELFGTSSGPISDTGSTVGCGFRRIGSWMRLSSRCVTWEEVELRMSAIAVILAHDERALSDESPVPGRRTVTVRVGAVLRRGGGTSPEVPFLVVRGAGSRWFVEAIDLERLTRTE